MKPYKIEILSKKHNPMINAFFCIENDNMLMQYNSKQKRKIKRHSKEMDTFIKTIALDEQDKGLNTTHLLIDTDKKVLVGFISLCNDSIILDPDEVIELNVPYFTIPAVKIARLAIHRDYRNGSLGRFLIGYCTVLIARIKKYAGVALVTLDCYEDKINYYQQLGFKLNAIQEAKLDYDNLYSMRITVYQLAEIIQKDLLQEWY